MKQIKAESKIQAARLLLKIIEQRKDLEKQEKQLKDMFKAEMGNDSIAKAGSVLITLTQKERRGLDRAMLEQQFGIEPVRGCETVTTYLQIDLKEDRAFESVETVEPKSVGLSRILMSK